MLAQMLPSLSGHLKANTTLTQEYDAPLTTQAQIPVRTASRPLIAYVAILTMMIALALTSPFVRSAQIEGVASLLIVVARFSLASLLLFPFIVRNGHLASIRQISLNNLRYVLLAGVFLAVELLLWTVSLEFTIILISATLLNTNMLWAAIMETTLLGDRLKTNVIIGMLVAFSGGLYLLIAGDAISTSGSRPVLGNALAAVSAIALAAYLVVGRKQRGSMPLLPYIWLVYTVAALIGIVVLIISRTPVLGYSSSGYFWLIMVAVTSQVIGHSSMNFAVRHFTATYVGVTQQVIPGLSAVFAFFWFDELPTIAQVIATLVVLSGVLIATLGHRRKKPDVEAQTTAQS